MEPSLMSKTKDNVDHAGLSVPSEPLKEPGKLKEMTFKASLNPSSSTALENMEIKDVTED